MNNNSLSGGNPELVFDFQATVEEQVSIIIVHKDVPDWLNLCLQSITLTSLNNNYEVIVVDNGSTKQDSIVYLDDLEQQGIKVIRNPDNFYWSKAANQGAAAASPNSKYFIFMHPDVVILDPSWMDLLIGVIESQDCGMVGVDISSYDMPNQKVDFIQEYCLLVTKELWKDCGPFDERLPQIGHAFVLTLTAQMRGYRPQAVKSSLVHHYNIFTLDKTKYNDMKDEAQMKIPVIMRELQLGSSS